jgi:hypothetical protein
MHTILRLTSVQFTTSMRGDDLGNIVRGLAIVKWLAFATLTKIKNNMTFMTEIPHGKYVCKPGSGVGGRRIAKV